MYRHDLPTPKVDPVGLSLPKVPWSFSALEKFETCARQYGDMNVLRKYQSKPSDAMEMGTEVHKALENYIQYKKELPLGLVHIGALVDQLGAGALRAVGEQQVAFTYLLQPCDTFDDDVCYRGKIDYQVLRQDAAVVVDFKTGQSREGNDQLVWMCIATLLQHPQ